MRENTDSSESVRNKLIDAPIEYFRL